jgi:uncharacterized protein (UPF0332 family)
MNKEWEELIRYRFQGVLETKEEARVLIQTGRLLGAVNRIYYAIFHATKAVLATEKLESSKHSGVVAIFHKEFVHTGKIEKEYGKIIDEAFRSRSKSDYIDYTTFDQETVTRLFKDCEAFLERIKSFLEGSIGKI